MNDLAFIAAEPRPTGSTRSSEVADYLVQQLESAGLRPERQRTLVVSDGSPVVTLAAVENIVARIPGTTPGKAMLISGHYDSVTTSTGASDCGACVATVLEAARVIQAGPALQNDVIVLFTDAEELGVIGARGFMQQHPWAKDIGLSIVFEGYGTNGASMLYVTGEDDGWFADQAVSSVASPRGYSFLNDIMWMLAGNTGSDLDALLVEGAPGLGFIYFTLEGAPAYHTLDDNVSRLEVGSLQSHGDWAVDLLRHFGNNPLADEPSQPNLVYFSVAPAFVVRYPSSLALPLAVVASLLVLAVAVIGLRRHSFTLGGLVAGLCAILVTLIACVFSVTLTWWLVRYFNPALHDLRLGGWPGASLYLAAFVALALFILSAVNLLFLRRISPQAIVGGSLLLWTVFTLLFCSAMPGFSYLFTWPLLVAALAFLAWILSTDRQRSPWLSAVDLAVPATVAIMLVLPAIYVLAVYAGRMEAMLGLPLAALSTPFTVLLMALVWPALAWVTCRRPGWLPVGSLVAMLILVTLATIRSIPSAERPATNTLMYWQDANQHRAWWRTVDDSRAGRGVSAQLDEWNSQVLGDETSQIEFNPWTNGNFDQKFPALQSEAPWYELPHTRLEASKDLNRQGFQSVTLEVLPETTAFDGQVTIDATAPLRSAALNGQPLALGSSQSSSLTVNRAGTVGPFTIEYEIPAYASAVVTLRDRVLGLPSSDGFQVPARPANMIPAPWSSSGDSTIVEYTVTP